MNQEILRYDSNLSAADREICQVLTEEIDKALPESKSKIWHGSPVWFINDNPIVGYSKLKHGVQLLFWSGQSFEEVDLKPVGNFKAAEVLYTAASEIGIDQLSRWLKKSIGVQWDYKNIVKRKGELTRLKEEDHGT